MIKKSNKPKLNFNIVHDMALAFASARMNDYKYPSNMNSNELRKSRYSNFLVDYAYVIDQYKKTLDETPSNPNANNEKPFNISVTLFDSIVKLSNSD